MTVNSVFSYGHLSDFLKSDFLFHIHFSVVICDFLVLSSQITIVPMHVPFKIHYRNNLIDKKDSYLIPRPPSQDDRNYSYGHQLYPSEIGIFIWQTEGQSDRRNQATVSLKSRLQVYLKSYNRFTNSQDLRLAIRVVAGTRKS